MSYKQYANARDAAWAVLLECGIHSLPVKPSKVCKHYGWILTDYQSGAKSIDLLGFAALKKKTDGFRTISQNHVYIFFDGSLPSGRQRFTVAHEIGHLILGHVGLGRLHQIQQFAFPS